MTRVIVPASVTLWRKVGEEFTTPCINCTAGKYECTSANGVVSKYICSICHGSGSIKTIKREHVALFGDVTVNIDVDAIAAQLARIALRNKTGRATMMKGMIKAKVIRKTETPCP